MAQETDSPHGLTLPSDSAFLLTKTRLAINRVIAINLSILEDLANEHDAAMAKLRDALPADLKSYVDLADHFDDVKFGTLRNRILRACNDAGREIEETIQNLRIE
jgi:hypothetical protein